MRRRVILGVFRCAVSTGLSIILVIGATRLRHVNHTTVALALVLLILGLSTKWGWMEALAASLAGGLAFDYFVLPPHGFSLEAPEHLVALVAFLLTAIATGQLSARLNRHRIEAERHRDEMAKLYRLGSAVQGGESAELVLQTVPGHIVEILPAREAAFFDRKSGQFYRSGAAGDLIPDERLREVADTGEVLTNVDQGTYIIPIWRNGNLAGSLGIEGISLSGNFLDAVVERVGFALARAQASQETITAELARRSEDLKSAFLAALAHEIKGPLATIKVCVGTLQGAKAANSAEQRELLAIIDEESARIARWIDNAIEVSGSEVGELRLDRKPNSIRRVATRALEGLGPRASGRMIDVRIPESLPYVAFDADLIEKVLRLVLDNAVKYSPPGSPLGVSAEFTESEIVLTVEDHGCGIPASERERIFEKHYRGSAAAEGVPGSGLGLASAKCIVEAHGGEIWVTNPVGSGSVFHISLPAITVEPYERIESLERR